MTQQQMSKLLDVSDRTLRDWKSNRSRLYTLLENLEYTDVKNKIDVVDLSDEVEFNPQEFSTNLFGKQVILVIKKFMQLSLIIFQL